MPSQHLPDNNAWDRFWSRGKPHSSSAVSWSKKRITGIACPYGAAGACVLDAGCGSGYFSKYFFDQGAAVTALDYAQEALRMTRDITEGRVATIRTDLVRDDLKGAVADQRYDLIFSDGLFEHFEPGDQDKILANFCSVLNDEGVILTVVPNRWSPWQLIRPWMMPGIDEKPFLLKELIAMHERHDLQIVDAGGINVLPFYWSPEFLGPYVGMLVYVIAEKPDARSSRQEKRL